MIKTRYMLISLLILFSIPLAFSLTGQTLEMKLDIHGVCREFNATLITSGFDAGCYDVKIDVTTQEGRVGEIFDDMEGWKSTFYYVKNGFCVTQETQSENRTFLLRADTDIEKLNFKARMQKGPYIYESAYYDVTQDCKQYWRNYGLAILVALVVILVLFVSIVIYVKH